MKLVAKICIALSLLTLTACSRTSTPYKIDINRMDHEEAKKTFIKTLVETKPTLGYDNNLALLLNSDHYTLHGVKNLNNNLVAFLFTAKINTSIFPNYLTILVETSHNPTIYTYQYGSSPNVRMSNVSICMYGTHQEPELGNGALKLKTVSRGNERSWACSGDLRDRGIGLLFDKFNDMQKFVSVFISAFPQINYAPIP